MVFNSFILCTGMMSHISIIAFRCLYFKPCHNVSGIQTDSMNFIISQSIPYHNMEIPSSKEESTVLKQVVCLWYLKFRRERAHRVYHGTTKYKWIQSEWMSKAHSNPDSMSARSFLSFLQIWHLTRVVHCSTATVKDTSAHHHLSYNTLSQQP